MNSPFDPQQFSQSSQEDFSPSPGATVETGVDFEPKRSGIKQFFGRPWRGEVRLWQAFWLYGFLGGIILNVVLGILGTAGVMAGMGLIIGSLSILLILVFAVWNGVSVWRCAWNASAKFWGYFARVLVVLSIFGYISMVVSLVGMMFMGSVAKKIADNTDVQVVNTSDGSSSGLSITMKSSSGSGSVDSDDIGSVVDTSTTTSADGSVITTIEKRSTGLVITKTQTRAPDGTWGVHVERSNPAQLQGVDNSEGTASATSGIPATPPVTASTAPTTAAAPDACQQRMVDAANQYKVDPQTYIAQNQAWLAQCRQSMAAQPQAQPQTQP